MSGLLQGDVKQSDVKKPASARQFGRTNHANIAKALLQRWRMVLFGNTMRISCLLRLPAVLTVTN